MIRTFFALPISEALEEALSQQASTLQGTLHRLPLRWVSPENYHITLAFLGDIRQADLLRLESISASVAKKHKPSLLSVADVRWFPSVDKPYILVADIEPNKALQQLQGDLQQTLRVNQFFVERRRFRPHISLARAGGNRLAQGFELPPCPVQTEMDELVLFESQQRLGGSFYSPLFVHELGVG